MSSCSFGQFELDTDTRQLRLRGEEICLQPRVFDLLAFLVAHRERVVDKEELLSTLWPGVVVTDASLQRAVSLLRSALRQGGMENAIRTYARRGYRCWRVSSSSRRKPPSPAVACAAPPAC